MFEDLPLTNVYCALRSPVSSAKVASGDRSGGTNRVIGDSDHSTGSRTEFTHYRLYECAKSALVKFFVHPYATVCDLYCGGGADAEQWDEAQIGRYIGIDVSSSGISQRREAWESQRKVYTAEFFEIDPCILCFQTEKSARRLLNNVSSLLKPGGYFFGVTPDSSTICAKYQKNVEAYHNRGSGMKPNIVPNCIWSESYMITLEVEEEKFPLLGKKYQLKFTNDVSAETRCLVHFPSFIRLAREVGLEYVEIQNLTESFDDNRAQYAGMITNSCPNMVDPRGRLLPRSFDGLGLYTAFIFQKPDLEFAPAVMTPYLQNASYGHDEREWRSMGWKNDEMAGHPEPPAPPFLPTLGTLPTPPAGLGNISEQKGILGPGPAELRFAEAL